MAGTTVRPATGGDAGDIAAIHVGSWRAAYRGMVPDALLESLSIERLTGRWRQDIASLEAGSEARVWVAERDGRLVGFASTGSSRDEDATDQTAQLITLYVHPDAMGGGAGQALLDHATDDLRTRGYAEATLWVLASNNRTRRFYERSGWRHDGTVKTEPFGEWPLEVARYRIPLAGR